MRSPDLSKRMTTLYISSDSELVRLLAFSLAITTLSLNRASSTSRFLNLLDLVPVKAALASCHPNLLLIHFLSAVGFDSSVLLDFLMSSETQFLSYFLAHLKLMEASWQLFCAHCHSVETAGGAASSPEAEEESVLERVMACLIRLRLSLTSLWAKDLFPYNPSPLVRRLERLESLYDGE